MTRSLLLLASTLGLWGCAPTLRSIDRGQWVLVTSDDNKSQVLITQDAYEKEVVAGRERKVKLAIDEKGPVLHQVSSPLLMKPGEVLRFRLDEGPTVDFQSDEAVAEAYWTESYRVDGWKNDHAIETKESLLYLRGLKPGTGKVKLIDAARGTHEYEVIVK